MTNNGDITIENAQGTIHATVSKKGNVFIDQAKGDLSITTNRGKITINDSTQNIYAQSQTGIIDVMTRNLPPETNIKLATSSSIKLSLPTKVNANIQASSRRGTVMCEHPVTQSLTTTLDQVSWKKFKRSVDGTIGSGTSHIIVQSNKNIKISKNETT